MVQRSGMGEIEGRQENWTGLDRSAFLHRAARLVLISFLIWASIALLAWWAMVVLDISGLIVLPALFLVSVVPFYQVSVAAKRFALARQTDVRGGTPPRLCLPHNLFRSEIPFRTPVPLFYGTIPAAYFVNLVLGLPITLNLALASLAFGSGAAFLAVMSLAINAVFLIGALSLLQATNAQVRLRPVHPGLRPTSSDEVTQ